NTAFYIRIRQASFCPPTSVSSSPPWDRSPSFSLSDCSVETPFQVLFFMIYLLVRLGRRETNPTGRHSLSAWGILVMRRLRPWKSTRTSPGNWGLINTSLLELLPRKSFAACLSRVATMSTLLDTKAPCQL